MPFFSLPVPVIALALAGQERKSQDIGGLEVKYEKQVEIDTETGRVTFEGSVVAKYDQTVVKCERLSLDYKAFQGVAEGGVELVDPEALLTTDRLEFNWKLRTGQAQDVYVRIGNMRMWAGSLNIEPAVWTLHSASATLSRRPSPDYKLTSRTVRIIPGKYGIAEKVDLNLFGARLGTAPEMRFDLDPRIDGFNLPSITNRKGVGLGASWTSSFLFSDRLVLGANWGSFPAISPGYGLDLTYMSADPNKTFNKVKPQDDLKEQMGNGWFDNISVRSPLQESGSIGNPRTLYSIATKWNTSTFARKTTNTDVSKELELVFDTAGRNAGFPMRLTGRLQRIRQDSQTPFVDRAAGWAIVQTPVALLTSSLGFVGRADLFTTASKQGEYQWLRGQLAMIWNPHRGVTIGAAYSSTRTRGTADFLFDEPLYKQAIHTRLDAILGPYTFRYLLKVDPSTGEVFDKEYEIALVAESFQPFMIVREFPNDYRIGFRFRIDNFVSRLQHRQVSRNTARSF